MYARSDQKARRRQAKSFRRREKNMPQIQNKALCIEKKAEKHLTKKVVLQVI